jgi:rRNA maturation endonuclease Nob1
METAEKRPVENEMVKREVKKAVPYKRVCHSCGKKTLDEHETICLDCGAGTRIYEGE